MGEQEGQACLKMPRLYLLLVLSLSVPVGAGVSALALLSGGLEFAQKTGGYFQSVSVWRLGQTVGRKADKLNGQLDQFNKNVVAKADDFNSNFVSLISALWVFVAAVVVVAVPWSVAMVLVLLDFMRGGPL